MTSINLNELLLLCFFPCFYPNNFIAKANFQLTNFKQSNKPKNNFLNKKNPLNLKSITKRNEKYKQIV